MYDVYNDRESMVQKHKREQEQDKQLKQQDKVEVSQRVR